MDPFFLLETAFSELLVFYDDWWCGVRGIVMVAVVLPCEFRL